MAMQHARALHAAISGAAMLLASSLILLFMAWPAAAQGQTQDLRVVGDALLEPLTTTPGDAVRGRAIVANRQVGLCLLCHAGPFPEERFQGNLAPDLAGSGTRWSEGQLRLRLVNARQLNPDSIMPAYFQTEGLNRVSQALQGRPLLSAQQIEDVVALLVTLR